MKHPLLSLLLSAVACVGTGQAQAVVSCNVSAIDPFHTSYDALLTAPTRSSGTLTVTCSRTAAGDPEVIGVELFANNGVNAQGSTNQAKLGTSALTYELFTDAGYLITWTGNGKKSITGTLNLGGGVPSTASTVLPYYSQIIPSQLGGSQGIHTDTVTISMIYGDNARRNTSQWTSVTSAASLSVQINNQPICVFVTPPGTVAFNYTSFSPAPVTASTTFTALCSTSLPYTMALSDRSGTPTGMQTSGVLTGLQYTLTLSASTGIGSGTAQFYTISGSMPAGQAGACSGAVCNEQTSHTLTISY